MKKILIIFYSRTGTTKKLAELIKQKTGATSEEIISVKNRQGALGYLMSGKEAMQKILAEIKPAVTNPSDYDLVVVGTPMWAWNLSSPVRAYLTEQKDKFKKVAFFCTMGSSEPKPVWAEMENICGQKPIATLGLTTKGVLSGAKTEVIEQFLQLINL